MRAYVYDTPLVHMYCTHTQIYIYIYIYICIYRHAYAYTHKSGARVFPTKLLTRKKTGLEKERASSWVGRRGEGDAARERHRGGYEKWEGRGSGGWSRSEKPGAGERSEMEEDGASRATGRGRAKERKRLDRISSLRVTMGGSIEKII